MILDSLANASAYAALHPGFRIAFDFLAASDLEQFPTGRHELDGQRLFVLFGRDAGRGRDGARLETHRKYIDIQLVVSGQEEIGWKPAAECASCDALYDATRDIAFFADRPEVWLQLPPGRFAIFYPHDAHAPLAGSGEVFKAVCKVAVGW